MHVYDGEIRRVDPTGELNRARGQDSCRWHPSRSEHGTGESTREEGKGTVLLAEATAMGKGPEVGTS